MFGNVKHFWHRWWPLMAGAAQGASLAFLIMWLAR